MEKFNDLLRRLMAALISRLERYEDEIPWWVKFIVRKALSLLLTHASKNISWRRLARDVDEIWTSPGPQPFRWPPMSWRRTGAIAHISIVNVYFLHIVIAAVLLVLQHYLAGFPSPMTTLWQAALLFMLGWLSRHWLLRLSF